MAIEQAAALHAKLGLCQLRSPSLKPAYLRFRGVGTVIEIVRREFRVRASFRFNWRMARATPVTRRDDDVVPVRDLLDSSSVTRPIRPELEYKRASVKGLKVLGITVLGEDGQTLGERRNRIGAV